MSELPSGWSIVPLEDVSEKVTDGTHKTPNYVESGVRFISIKNIRAYKPIDWDAYERYITREEHEELIKRCKPEKGDIVFPRIGTLGFAKIVDWDIEFSLFVGLGLVKPDRYLIEPKYLEHYMNSPFVAEYSKGKATGTGRMTLALAESKRLPVLLPPLVEQTRIAQKLDELLAQVDTLKARIDGIPALLKRFRQSVLAAAASGRLTGTGEDSGLPSGWQEVPLASVIDDLRYGTAQKCEYNGGAIGVLRIPNIGENGINLDDLKSSDFSELEINKLSLRRGDIVLIRSNGSVELVGKSAVVSHKEEKLLFAGYLIRIRLDTRKALPEYVNYWLKSPATRQVIELTARSTSGVNNINSEPEFIE